MNTSASTITFPQMMAVGSIKAEGSMMGRSPEGVLRSIRKSYQILPWGRIRIRRISRNRFVRSPGNAENKGAGREAAARLQQDVSLLVQASLQGVFAALQVPHAGAAEVELRGPGKR